MRYSFTDEMHELMKIYEPYEEGCHLVADAPPEAVEAKKKFDKLDEELYKQHSRLDLL